MLLRIRVVKNKEARKQKLLDYLKAIMTVLIVRYDDGLSEIESLLIEIKKADQH